MQSLSLKTNPFALMLDPQAVFAQITHSERLERLQSRICRPLDKPLLAPSPDESGELSELDRADDRSGDGFSD